MTMVYYDLATHFENKNFTQEEKDAVKKGVAKFGAGKWQEMKNHFKNELRNRKNTDIRVNQTIRKYFPYRTIAPYYKCKNSFFIVYLIFSINMSSVLYL